MHPPEQRRRLHPIVSVVDTGKLKRLRVSNKTAAHCTETLLPCVGTGTHSSTRLTRNRYFVVCVERAWSVQLQSGIFQPCIITAPVDTDTYFIRDCFHKALKQNRRQHYKKYNSRTEDVLQNCKILKNKAVSYWL